jgi:hypothetical protein
MNVNIPTHKQKHSKLIKLTAIYLLLALNTIKGIFPLFRNTSCLQSTISIYGNCCYMLAFLKIQKGAKTWMLLQKGTLIPILLYQQT